MPRRLSPFPLWPFGLSAGAAAASWVLRQRWSFPVRAHEREVPHVRPAPPTPRPHPAGRPALQDEDDGVGPRFHRRYRVDVGGTQKTPHDLIACIESDIQAFVPSEIATFNKVRGDDGRFAVGDEFDIDIRSPWNGPVRVVEKTPTGFTFATLAGHMEAGVIRFEAADHPRQSGALRFTIESWARSRDGVVDLVYDRLGVAKEAQGAMWSFFCAQVVASCGGEQLGEIDVETEREADRG